MWRLMLGLGAWGGPGVGEWDRPTWLLEGPPCSPGPGARPILSGQRCSPEGWTVLSGHSMQSPWGRGAHRFPSCWVLPPPVLAPPLRPPTPLAGLWQSPRSWRSPHPQTLPVSPALSGTPLRTSPPLKLPMVEHRLLPRPSCSPSTLGTPLPPFLLWGHPGLWLPVPPLPPWGIYTHRRVPLVSLGPAPGVLSSRLCFQVPQTQPSTGCPSHPATTAHYSLDSPS